VRGRRQKMVVVVEEEEEEEGGEPMVEELQCRIDIDE